MSEWALFFNDHTCQWEEWPVPGTNTRAMPYETREPVIVLGDNIENTKSMWPCSRCGFDMPAGSLRPDGSENPEAGITLVCKDRESCDARTDGQGSPDGATIHHARELLAAVITGIKEDRGDFATAALMRLQHIDGVLRLLAMDRSGGKRYPLHAMLSINRLERRVLDIEQKMIQAGLSFRDTIPRAKDQEEECEHDYRPVGFKPGEDHP